MKKLLLASAMATLALTLGLPAEGCSGGSRAQGIETSEEVDEPGASEEIDSPTPKPGRPSGKKESMSFILLGDIHYCEDRFYDLESMLQVKPSDHRQITQTYAPVTKANWTDQIGTIKSQIEKTSPAVKGVVQLGDISEGLANVDGNADKIAENLMTTLRNTNLGVPWILVKGNHDITGVGDDCKKQAKSAFGKYYTPFIKEQIGKEDVTEGNYSYQIGEVLFVILDAYNSSIDQTAFAKKALEGSDAKYKFVCMHEPAIPATERCWHYLKSKPEETRNAFLKVIAENKAFFLCGHLHRYSVLRRNTEWGPIVQVMVNSVTNVKRSTKPSYELGLSNYGEYLVDWKPDYSPDNKETRRAQLKAEAPFVDFYQMTSLAGYAVLSIDAKAEKVSLKYYTAFNDTTPYDEIDLTELYNRK